MDGDGTSEAVLRRAPPRVRRCIASYQGYRQIGEPATHTGLPSPYLIMIVSLDEPLVVARHPDPRQAPGSYRTLVGGLHTTPATIAHGGRQSGIQLNLSPLGVRALTGMPAAELTGLDVAGPEVFGRLADELHERVVAGPSWARRFAVLDEMLGDRIGADGQVPAPLVRSWVMLTAPTATTVSDVAREVGWSERHLRQRFRAEFGLSPVEALRIGRFDRARRSISLRAAAGQPLDLANVAAMYGYYDQSHLAGEFREFAGSAPSRWVAHEFRYLQADVASHDAGWAHE